MKLIVKTLSGKQLPLEIEDGWTVGQIKQKIEADHEMKAETLKLIAYGKVLDSDAKLASEYNIKEGDFIVAMVQKPKAAKKPAAPKKEEVKKEEPVPQAQPAATQPPAQAEPAQPVQPAPVQPQPAAEAQPVAQAQPAAEITPEQEEMITNLIALTGQPRELCIRALAVGQNIPDVAFELLMSGQINEIPEGAVLGGVNQGDDGYDDVEDEPGQPGGQAAAGGDLSQYNLTPEVIQQLEALRSNPSFPHIRQRMLQDPNFAQQFMAQLQNTQPLIWQAIQSDSRILMNLILGHDPMAGMGAGGAPGGMPGAGQQQPPPGSIQVSPEEMEQINMLVSYGFTKARAAEAYFACDKNVEMAANFLFEAGADDEDTAMQNAINASAQEAIPPVNVPVANVEPANAEPANAEPVAQQEPAAEENAEMENQDGAEGGDAANDNQDAAQQQNNDNNGENNNGGNDNADAGAGGAGGSSLV